jgi:hypothetical protein
MLAGVIEQVSVSASGSDAAAPLPSLAALQSTQL